MLLVITFYLNMCTLVREERSGQIILHYIRRQLDKIKDCKKEDSKLVYILLDYYIFLILFDLLSD